MLYSDMGTRRPLIENPFVIISLLALFFLLRLIGFLQPHFISFDDAIYSTLGFQLRHYPTNYSTESIFSIVDRFRPHEMEYLNRPLFKHPPLYPLTLALSYFLFGTHVFSALLPSLLAWMGICFLVRKIAAHLFDPQAGFVAYVFCLMDPMGWMLSVRVYAECLETFFLLWAVWLYIRDEERSSPFAGGILLGLACLVKYSAALYLGFFVLFFLLRRQFRRIWEMCLAFGLVLTPWIGVQAAAYWDNLWQMLHEDFFIPPQFLLETILTILFCYLILQPVLLHSAKSPFWKSPFGLWLSRFALFLCMLIPILCFGAIGIKLFAWEGLPMTSFSRAFPSTAGFYFYQPLLYFPFLVLVPVSPFLLFKKENVSRLYLIFLLVLGFFAAASFWQNPQIRYLYPIIPLVIVLAAGTCRNIWAGHAELPQPAAKITGMAILFLGIFFTAKTLRVDWFVAFVNLAGRF